MATGAPNIPRISYSLLSFLASWLVFLKDIQRTDGRTKHMARIGKSEQHIIKNTETPVVVIAYKMAHDLIYIRLLVEGLHFGFMEFIHFLIIPSHILGLYVGCIGKHQCA